jgi:hypothetical protein
VSYWRRRRDGAWTRVVDGKKETLWGMASTGRMASQGSVTQIEHPSGRVDAVVRPEPVSLSASVRPRADIRPTSTVGTFRVARLDDDLFVALRDVERLVRDAGYGYLSDLLVRACGLEPAQDRIVIPTVE